jgi:hypothetical protein
MAKSGDIRHGLCARSQLVFLAAAAEDGANWGARFDVECADALGAVEFVAGEGEEIDREHLHIDRGASGDLDSIGVEAGTVIVGDLG